MFIAVCALRFGLFHTLFNKTVENFADEIFRLTL